MEARSGNCYTSEMAWYSRRGWKDVEKQWKEIYSRLPADSSKLRSAAARWQDELKGELESLGKQLVSIDGEFDDSLKVDSLTFVMTFSADPKASFIISLPKEALKTLPTTRPLRLTVFGHVSKALGNDGCVDIAAIAVF